MSLIAFDFDGTLSDSEMTVLLAKRAGVADEVAEITERAMNDELSYAESLYQRAELLGGLDEDEVAAAFDEVALRPDAGELIERLQAEGHHVAVLTGGFESGVERARARRRASRPTRSSPTASRRPAGRSRATPRGRSSRGRKMTRWPNSPTTHPGIPMVETVGGRRERPPDAGGRGTRDRVRPKDAVRPVCDDVVDSMFRLGKVLEGYDILPAE